MADQKTTIIESNQTSTKKSTSPAKEVLFVLLVALCGERLLRLGIFLRSADRDLGCGDRLVGNRDVLRSLRRGQELLEFGEFDRKAHVLNVRADELAVHHADQSAVDIDRGTARIAAVDRGVGLDEGQLGIIGEGFARGGNQTRGSGQAVALRVAEHQKLIAAHHFAVVEGDRRPSVAHGDHFLDLAKSKVVVGIAIDELQRVCLFVVVVFARGIEHRLDRGVHARNLLGAVGDAEPTALDVVGVVDRFLIVDHVVVGDHIAVLGDHKAGALATEVILRFQTGDVHHAVHVGHGVGADVGFGGSNRLTHRLLEVGNAFGKSFRDLAILRERFFQFRLGDVGVGGFVGRR